MQMSLFSTPDLVSGPPAQVTSHKQLLKWIGNKQRFAAEIVKHFPVQFGCYHEPFLGSAAVLGRLAPKQGVGSDTFAPLVEIWTTLRHNPAKLKRWYAERYDIMVSNPDRKAGYAEIKASYNSGPNGADLLFLCRSCYGGVVRFRKADGYMSTPCGVHQPIKPESFAERADAWHHRVQGSEFHLADYADAMRSAKPGDLVYCDPPYTHSQTILYGAQAFSLETLFSVVAECRTRGVYVAVSIDGTKKSGNTLCGLPIPTGLFEREVYIDCGRSMLRRFQMGGETLEAEGVSDRLLLTY